MSKKKRLTQIRVNHMNREQLEALLKRREIGVRYVKFLISQLKES